MLHLRALLTPVVGLGLLAAACAESRPVPGTSASAAMAGCPRLICGNTPYLGAFPFWELDETGTSYAANDLRIAGAINGVTPVTLRVDGFKVRTFRVSDGAELAPAGTLVRVRHKDGAAAFDLTLQPGPALPYYGGGNDGTMVPTYRITYSEWVGARRRPSRALCGTDGGTVPREAILFKGDRYDRTTGAVSATGAAAGSWFNVTCKEDALWKLALFRHVEAASAPGFTTTVAERTAALRGIRADYCGDGTPLTELGTAVEWWNLGGWLQPETDPSLEAIWTATGAACIDGTRIPDVEVPCARPTCAAMFSDWTAHGTFMTLVPAEI